MAGKRANQGWLLRSVTCALLATLAWASQSLAQSQSSDFGYQLAPLSDYEYADILRVQNEEELPNIEPLEEPALDEDLDSLLNMDVDRLSNVNVRDISTNESQINVATGTLTATSTDSASPATVTHISAEMIQKSGARNLNEVLDIFVPNLQIIRHHGHYSHVGIRGIISDREDKYLLRVNGRVMNQRFVVGADSERDLPLLRDIATVDVVRGLGSSTYGPGAIAGVINITTFNGTTFEGIDGMARQGFEQEMSTGEVRWGKRWGRDTSSFIYYGFADQNGADAGDSPYVFPRTGTAPNGFPPVVAGDPSQLPTPNDEMSFFGDPKHKLHFQFTHETWDFWARYTKGGYFNANQATNVLLPPYGTATAGTNLYARPGGGGDYQQLTFFGSKIYEVSEDFNVSAVASYDFYDWVYYRLNSATPRQDPVREEETYFRIMGQYTPADRHALALGYEHSYETFGLDTPLTDAPTRGQRLNFITRPWHTNTGSIFGEHRYEITEDLTSVFSARWDKHTYSDILFSPRLGLLLQATDIDLLKFSIGQSVRKAGDEELRAQYINSGTIADSEVLESTEFRWERTPNDRLLLASSIFIQDHDVLGFSGSLNRSDLLGRFESWGFELESVYDMGSSYLTLSHGYVKLLDAELVNPTLIQAISAMPYGFGDDFANWSNNVSKIAIARDMNEQLNLSSSLRVYWGFPGAEDLAAFNNTLPTISGAIAQSDPGYSKASRANVYLDLGSQYRWTENISLRADLYNVLGWFDINLNKRNYINRVTEYRPEAAAAGVSVIVAY
jgi:outer membrane receptor protein involved in Fe transport